MLLTSALLSHIVQALHNTVQLACVKPAASVRSEPGSNSHIDLFNPVCSITHKEFSWFLYFPIHRLYIFFFLFELKAHRLRILFLFRIYYLL